MILLTYLVITSLIIVDSSDLFSDFATSLCDQRHELDGSIVCQPTGEFAARQCPPRLDICYCVTESGETLERTSYPRSRNYVCRNVWYRIEYRHLQKNAGFDVDDMVSTDNQLILKLSSADRSTALWESKGIEISPDPMNRDYRMYIAHIAGYNTRITQSELERNVRSSLGVSNNELIHLDITKTYDSVHDGVCPIGISPCREDAPVCYSDSQCLKHESCCPTTCHPTCIVTGSVDSSTSTTPTSTQGIGTTSTFPDSDTAFPTTEELWEYTSSDGMSTTASLGFGTTTSSPTQLSEEEETESWWETSESAETMTHHAWRTTTSGVETTSPRRTSSTLAPTSSETLSFELSSDTPPPTKELVTSSGYRIDSSTTPEITETSSTTRSGTATASTDEESDVSTRTLEMGFMTTSSEDVGTTTEGIPDEVTSTPFGTTTDELTTWLSSTTEEFLTSEVSSTTEQFPTTEEWPTTEELPSTEQWPTTDDLVTEGLFTTTSSLYSMCESEAFYAVSEGREGPLCLDDGSYSPEQCDQARGMCWCVDEKGLELKGSMRYGSAGPCENFREESSTSVPSTTVPLSSCWREYQTAVKAQAQDRDVMLPACQPNGLYQQSQCHGAHCWCVDESTGVMINGTRKAGQIDCHLYLDGMCPEYATDHRTSCFNKCESESHCYGTTKCCQTHCGTDCIYPQLPQQLKEGQCPVPKTLNSVFERCNVECSNDQQCQGSMKCCFNGCGYTCSVPVHFTNIYCKKVDYIEWGQIDDPRDQYSEGDILSISCDHGYKLEGEAQVKCLASGEWGSELPVCKRVSCGAPGATQFAVAQGSDYWVDGAVSYQCYNGYSLVGNSTITCQPNGRWSSEPPTCRLMECPEVNEIPYGRTYGELRTYGNRIGFRCDYGYTLVGSEQRLCLSDGTWSGTDASCVRGYFSRTKRHKFSDFDAMEEGGNKQERCQFVSVDTIDSDGDCVEDVRTVQCQCGEPETVQQLVKVLCQRGVKEYVSRSVKIGLDCSCCNTN